MRMGRITTLAALTLTLAAAHAAADVWDVGPGSDDTTATTNELIHGTDQLHDLGVIGPGNPDVDFYQIQQSGWSSWEVVVDSMSGDLDPLEVSLVASDGATVILSSQPAGAGSARVLRWQNATANPVTSQYVKVSAPACGVSCRDDDVYRIHAYETTQSIARFNNTGGQVTVLIVQNPEPTAAPVAATAVFHDAGGTELATQAFTVPARGLYSLGTPSISALAAQSGTITVTSDAGYGGLTGKAVALDPANGFSFDTPMVPRPAAVTASVGPTHAFCNSSAGCQSGDLCETGQCVAPANSCSVGENYDVDGTLADGCEVPDSPTGNHNSGFAVSLGSLPCFDGTSDPNASGRIPSDRYAHTFSGFDSTTGSAPDWFSIAAAGGICVDDFSITLAVTTVQRDCYRLRLTTDTLGTLQCLTDASGQCTISHGSGGYNDGSTIYLEVDKTCNNLIRQDATYTIHGHL